MELLQNLILVYKKVVNQRPITDPLRVQLRELILNCFSHDGFAAVRDIDAAPAQGQANKPRVNAQGKEMRRFVHPDAMAKTVKRVIPEPEPEAEEIVDPENPNAEALSMVGAALVGMASTDPVPDQVAPENKTPEQPIPATETVEQAPDQVAKLPNKLPGKPEGNESPALPLGQKQKAVAVDVDELVSMKPKAIAEKYGLEVLTNFAKTQAIEVRPGASATQIAAAILTKLKAA